MKPRYILFAMICCLAISVNAEEHPDSTKQEKGLKGWWNNLIHGNIDRTYERKLDMNFVLAPCYTREGGIGIGGAATALYRLDRTDSIMQPSDFSLSGSAMVKGIYTLTAKGNNHFQGNKSRLSYKLQLMHKTLDFWGISYDACAVNPVSEYTKRQIVWQSDYVYKLTPAFHVGAAFNINYTSLSKTVPPSYLEGQGDTYFFVGVGLSLQYDTRDFILNPQGGVYVMLREVIYPRCMSSYDKTLTTTTLQFNAYQPVWSGAIFAFDFYGCLNRECTPWPMREEVGRGTSRMRGYYGGRYIDCSQISGQVELRQHILGRLGCVAWVGGGNVFPSLGKLKWNHTLPNYGLGLRFEFKHKVNVRIDYGFGKETAGFVFQFAEAF